MPKLVMFARFRHLGENECNEQNFVQLRQARWKQFSVSLYQLMFFKEKIPSSTLGLKLILVYSTSSKSIKVTTDTS